LWKLLDLELELAASGTSTELQFQQIALGKL
jgi:hypothetical protein